MDLNGLDIKAFLTMLATISQTPFNFHPKAAHRALTRVTVLSKSKLITGKQDLSQCTQCWFPLQTVFKIILNSLLLPFLTCFHVYFKQTGYVERYSVIMNNMNNHQNYWVRFLTSSPVFSWSVLTEMKLNWSIESVFK